jgi:hypothetical protein
MCLAACLRCARMQRAAGSTLPGVNPSHLACTPNTTLSLRQSPHPAQIHLPLSTQATKAVPRSQDLTDQSLQDEEPLLGGEALKISTSASTSSSSSKASSMPGLARPKQQAQAQGQGTGAGLVQEVQLRGAKRTQELIRQNQKLPEADKAAVAEAERVKGNEFFRCGRRGRCCAVVCCASRLA